MSNLLHKSTQLEFWPIENPLTKNSKPKQKHFWSITVARVGEYVAYTLAQWANTVLWHCRWSGFKHSGYICSMYQPAQCFNAMFTKTQCLVETLTLPLTQGFRKGPSPLWYLASQWQVSHYLANKHTVYSHGALVMGNHAWDLKTYINFHG